MVTATDTFDTTDYLVSPRLARLVMDESKTPFSVSLWNDLADPVFDGVGLAGFKS